MATSDFWQKFSATVSSPEWTAGAPAPGSRPSAGTSRVWMLLDALTVVVAATVATLVCFKIGPVAGAREFWNGTLVEAAPWGWNWRCSLGLRWLSS